MKFANILQKPLITISVLLFAALYPAKADDLSADEAQSIVKDAYVYGFAIVENCKEIFGMSVYAKSPAYSGFNKFLRYKALYDSSFKTVVSANNDTLYSPTFANLRAEPLVINVPPTGERYFSMQLIDTRTDNIAYLGARATGKNGGNYLLVGPSWNGSLPKENFNEIYISQSQFVALAARTAVDSNDDIPKVIDLQKHMQLQPLSKFLGTASPAAAPEIKFPPCSAKDIFAQPTLFKY